jgi:beta-phosphoglucomutase-like phosphatase (HAD superfamily)
VRFDAVLFDCDGVLVDSEGITNRVLRDMLEEQGWTLTLQQCMDTFIGFAVMDKKAEIEAHTGKPLTPAWLLGFRERRNAALEAIEPIPNIHTAVQQLFDTTQGRIACASGADRPKIELMLKKVGLDHHFAGRIFSGHETPRSKPYPDVYLAAAAHLGVAPERCAVVEDTLNGLAAGVAAGATVFAYVPQGAASAQGQAMLAAGASQVFLDMAQLPGLLT